MTAADKWLAGLIAAMVCAAWLLVAHAHAADPVVTITGPEGVTTAPLFEPSEYRVAGRTGEVLVAVSSSSVRVIASTCPDQVCVRTSGVGAGGVIACVPNGVVVTAGGASDADGMRLDALSR